MRSRVSSSGLVSCSSLTSVLVVSTPNLLLLTTILLSLVLYPDSPKFRQFASQEAIDLASTGLVFLMCLVYPVTSPIIGEYQEALDLASTCPLFLMCQVYPVTSPIIGEYQEAIDLASIMVVRQYMQYP